MQLSKPIKFFFKALGGLVILLLITAVAIPYFFKDEILTRVKADINNTLDAEVDFSDVQLSLFRSFPDFYFSLEDFKITGKNEFENIELANIEELAFSLDLMSVINHQERPVEINELRLVRPNIHIITLRNGRSNYNIAKSPSPETQDTTEYNFLVQLESYSIQEGNFLYDDRLGDMFVELVDLNHSGTGDFTQDVFDLVTETTAQGITFKYDGINYLKRAKGDFDVTLNANIKENVYTLKDNRLQINNMVLNAEGSVQPEWEEIILDLAFNAPANNFKNLLSLIPNAYTRDFANVRADGQFQLNGTVKGAYNMETGALPAFNVNLAINNGSFQYPSLPLGMNNIATEASIKSPTSRLDDMVIDISKFNMKLGENPFTANLLLKTPISDPDIDARFNGIIELTDFSRAFPMEGVKQLDGRITADVEMKTTLSAIDRKNFEAVDMSGKMQIEDFDYEAEGIPLVAISDLQMQFNPRKVEIPNFTAKLGNSDLQASGAIDNILAYFSPAKTMTGEFRVESDYFDANQWVPAETTTESSGMVDTTSIAAKPFDRFKFNLNATVKKLDYDIYELTSTSFTGRVTPEQISVQQFQTQIGESDFAATGSINNVFNYLYENEILQGILTMRSSVLNLNQFMEPAPATSGQARNTANTSDDLEPVAIPKNIKMDIDAVVNQLQYTNVKLKNVTGKVKVADQAVRMEDCRARTFGGDLLVNGGYDTSNPEEPTFDLSYALESLQFQDAFEKLNTFQSLAPVAEYIKGKFNSTLKMDGTLGKDLMPKLESLNIDGFFQTIDGVISGFKPLEVLSDKLNLNELKKIELKNTKNWFEVANGKMTVKPFDLNVKDVQLTIAGEHSINVADMNYGIQARIPRELLEKNQVTATANKGLDFLTSKAKEVGIDIKDAEFINLAIKLTGSLQDPKFNITPTGADGSTSVQDIVGNALDEKKEEVKQAIGTAKDEAKDVVETAKEEVKSEVNTALDDAKDKGKSALDTIVGKPSVETVKDQAGKVLKDVLGKDKKDSAAADTTKTGAKTEDKVKEGIDKLKDLNPFKRKKNNN